MTPEQSNQAHSTALDVKIEVLKVEVQSVKAAVGESIAETRRWRDDVKADTAAMMLAFNARMDKHELQDDVRHAAIDKMVSRLENEALDAEKTIASRLDAVEKFQVASIAVESYKKWLVATIIIGGGSVIVNLLSALRIVDFTVR